MDADALVLCAGLGTRLRPLTDELPKPLVPIGDRPLLEHITSILWRAGAERSFVNVHHLSEVFLRNITQLNDKFEISVEAEILGTAGGIAQIRPRLEHDCLLVWNGDVLTVPPLRQLVQRARLTGGLCLAIRRRPAFEGTVGVGEGGAIVRLRGERFGPERMGGDYLGVAALGAECLVSLPSRGCLIGDWALPALRSGGSIHSVESEPAYWFDVGEPGSYLRANLSWLERTRGDGLASWAAANAQIASGVELEQSVVGPGALIEGKGTLRRTVVWPGARARAPLAASIVTSSGRVVPVPTDA